MKGRLSHAWREGGGDASPRNSREWVDGNKGRQKPTGNYNHSFSSEHSSREEEAPRAWHVEGATQAPAIEWIFSELI